MKEKKYAKKWKRNHEKNELMHKLERKGYTKINIEIKNIEIKKILTHRLKDEKDNIIKILRTWEKE